MNPYGQTEEKEEPAAMVVATQAREVAEIQAAMAIAKKFPRNEKACADRIILACQRNSLAESATYEYSKGGTAITGPSIRLAEAMAMAWGNMQFGVRELEQRHGESTVEAFAIDLENNVRCVKVFQVRHHRDTKSGGYTIKDQREIYELVANQGSRRVRACILALIPGDVVEAAVDQCDKTLSEHCDMSTDNIKKMVDAFSALGVTKEMIESRIQRSIDAITKANVIGLRKVYNSIKDGMSSAKEWFPVPDEKTGTQTVKKNAPIQSAGSSTAANSTGENAAEKK
ncbi:hypothetical protein VN12_04120 [Pirellula sp. SH-Sr6A]|nr:hypothetical protein VN12_04120 [Pirellula sp. SH-Sr6A]